MTAPPNKPNFNLIVERGSAVQENMEYAMLEQSGKPKTMWHFAFNAAAFTLDRCPRHSNPGNITPHEAFFGEKPDVKKDFLLHLLFPRGLERPMPS